MTGGTLAEAWPIYTPSRGSSRSLSPRETRTVDIGITAVLSFSLIVLSLVRRGRARRQWERRQERKAKVKAWQADDAPPSTDVAPLEVRVEGSPDSMVILGDDDEQFRLRARAGVVLFLDDGRPCTFIARTPLMCTFPGFTLVTRGGKGSVGVAGGARFFVVAVLPPGTEEPASPDDAHPFRQSAMAEPLELVPVHDRYECRLEAAPVKRKRLAKILPGPPDLTHPPRWRPYLYPGIPLAILWVFTLWGSPTAVSVVLVFSFIVLAIVEDGLSTMLRED